MKKTKNKKGIFAPLDDYERELKEFLDKGEYESATPEELEKTRKMFAEAVWVAKQPEKTKSITLRVKQKDLLRVKVKAKENNIPYQRLISTLIHQYAEGKMNIIL